MAQTTKRLSRKAQRAKKERRNQRLRQAGLAALGVAACAVLIALFMSTNKDPNERTYMIDDVSFSGELGEFTEPVAAMAWLDAAGHDRDLQTGTVGGDTVDFELADPLTPEVPCSSQTDNCLRDQSTEADLWADDYASTIELSSARGSDLVGPLVELDGAAGSLWYVTDGCLATVDPPQRLCQDLPRNEQAARRLGRQIAEDYGIEDTLEDLTDVYLVGVGSTVEGGLTGRDGALLRATLTSLLETAGVDPDAINVTAGLPA